MSMETAEGRAAFELLAGTSLTQHPVDNARAVAIIKAYGEAAIPEIMAKRAAWKVYLTRTQRQWQTHTRNANKARHRDSIAIREKYVRCA